MTRGTLWTVPQLTEGMDILWTAQDEWTKSKSRPQDAHPLLGQVIEWTTDLPTAAWITAQSDVAVTHTDHSDDDYPYFFEEKTGTRSDKFKKHKSKGSLTNYAQKFPFERRSKTREMTHLRTKSLFPESHDTSRIRSPPDS
jgi:hypothetical protein